LQSWIAAAGLTEGRVFCCINPHGHLGAKLSTNAVAESSSAARRWRVSMRRCSPVTQCKPVAMPSTIGKQSTFVINPIWRLQSRPQRLIPKIKQAVSRVLT
jgi:hypothetical protein